MRLIFLAGLIFCLTEGRTQDLTGIWRGHFRSGDLTERGYDDRYKFEVQIAQHSKNFDAVTYSYKNTEFYGKAEAEGTLNSKTRKVVLRELKLVDVKMMVGSDVCSMTCLMQYSRLGDDEFLEGIYTSMNIRDSSFCGKGTVFLHKVANSDFYVEPFLEKREKELESQKSKEPATAAKPLVDKPKTKPNPTIAKSNPVAKNTPSGIKKPLAPKPSVAKSTPESGPLKKPLAHVNVDQGLVATPSRRQDSVISIEKKIGSVVLPEVLANRKNELVKTIVVNTNEVELNIYDDGAIDNDTVSIYLDKKLVVSHAMLTDRAIVVKLHMDDNNNYHEVVMVADNEGEIPPNTSLMVVKAGDKQYEVRIVSTEQKNATVIFKFEKDKLPAANHNDR